MTNLSQLRKLANAAPKYTLFIEGAGYLYENQNLTGIVFTTDKSKAIKYAVGFDNPDIKTGIWNAEAKKMFNNSNVKFQIVNI